MAASCGGSNQRYRLVQIPVFYFCRIRFFCSGEKECILLPVFPVKGVKFIIWVSVAVLYVMQVSPVFYRLYNSAAAPGGIPVDSRWTYVGAAVMAVAILLESTADFQKSRAKKENPRRFCDRGLYKLVRCPNYLGEVLFWTGCFLSGIGALQGAGQWMIAAIGYAAIVYIMFGGARRLEIRQNKNYGADPEYQAYVNKTPVLIPFIPLYHLEKYTFLKG